MFLPFPDALNECIAAELAALFAFGVELALDHHLRCDACVVGTRLPERGVAAHAVIASQRIHQRLLECVPEVQRAGYVRWGDDDGVGRSIALWGEPAIRFPTLVDSPLNIRGRV